MKIYRKRVRTIVSRTGLDTQVKSRAPIGCGAGTGKNSKFASIKPGSEVCLHDRLLSCFTDAVIDKELHERVIEDGVVIRKSHIERIPRFHVTEKGYYICDRECKNIPSDCTGIPITGDDFKREFDIQEFALSRRPEDEEAISKAEEPVLQKVKKPYEGKKRGRKPSVIQEVTPETEQAALKA